MFSPDSGIHTFTLQDHLRQIKCGMQTTLTIDRPLTQKEFDQVLDAVETAPMLTELHFHSVQLMSGQVNELLDHLRGQKNLREFFLNHSIVQEETAAKLRDFLSEQKQLSKLQLIGCGMFDADIAMLAPVFKQLPELRRLDISHNRWGRQGTASLAEALARCRGLCALNADHKENSSLNDGLFATLMHTPHPHLLVSAPEHAFGLHRRMVLSHFLQAEDFLNTYCSDPAMQDFPPSRPIMPTNIYTAESLRRGLLHQKPEFKEKYAFFDRIMAMLPRLAPDEPTTIDNLLRANGSGFCPAENPLVWEERPHLLDELRMRGELTGPNAVRKTEKQSSLMEAAYAFLPAEKATEAFNRAGIAVRGNHLFAANGSATELLKIIHVKQELGCLFTPANWAGANARELNDYMAALPESVMPFIRLPLQIRELVRQQSQQANSR